MADRNISLVITGAAQTVPGLLVGVGKSPEGEEVAYVARPNLGRAVLAWAGKEKTLLWSSKSGDAPHHARTAVKPADAVAAVTQIRALQDPEQPASLRAKWTGALVFDEDGGVIVALARKIVSYGALIVASSAEGWRWWYEGKMTWFQPGQERNEPSAPLPTLAQAIARGVEGALAGPVSKACAVRDSHRRGALDPTYNALHPVKLPADPKRDPVGPWAARRAEKVPHVLEEPLGKPPHDVERAVGLVEDEAQELKAAPSWLRGTDRAPELAASATLLEAEGYRDTAKMLRQQGMVNYPQDTSIRATLWGDSAKPGAWADLSASLFRSAKREAGGPLPDAIRKVLMTLDTHVTGAPYVLRRARDLLRRAMELLQAPTCLGAEADDARRRIQEAIDVFESQRNRWFSEEKVDPRAIQHIATTAALAAAKIARACGMRGAARSKASVPAGAEGQALLQESGTVAIFQDAPYTGRRVVLSKPAPKKQGQQVLVRVTTAGTGDIVVPRRPRASAQPPAQPPRPPAQPPRPPRAAARPAAQPAAPVPSAALDARLEEMLANAVKKLVEGGVELE